MLNKAQEHLTPEKASVMLTSTSVISCAWCLTEQKLPLGNGSHGICLPHAQAQYELLQARKARRAA